MTKSFYYTNEIPVLYSFTRILSPISHAISGIGSEVTSSERKGNIAANNNNLEKSRSQQIKSVLKAGAKLGFNVVLESLKTGGVDVYLRKQAIEGGKKVGSYVANSIADRIRATLSGKSITLSNNSVDVEPCKSYMVGINQGTSIKPSVIGINGTTPKSHEMVR